MCTQCMDHGWGEQWYMNLENFLFKKIFPTPEEQQQAKATRLAEVQAIEWQERHPKYALDPQYQRQWFKANAAQVVTMEESLRILSIAEEAVKREDTTIVLGRCGCAMMQRGKIEYRCIFFGMPITWAAEVGFARYPREGLTEFGGADWRELRSQLRKGTRAPLTAAEAKELFKQWDDKGLVHTVVTRGLFPLIDGFCNCERPICMRLRQRDRLGLREAVVKGSYVARVDQGECTNCGDCTESCQFGAIHVSKWSRQAAIDPEKCFGCGLCRAACSQQAISMVPRLKVPAAASQW